VSQWTAGAVQVEVETNGAADRFQTTTTVVTGWMEKVQVLALIN